MDLGILPNDGAAARPSAKILPLFPAVLVVAGAWACLGLMSGDAALPGFAAAGSWSLCGAGPEPGGAPLPLAHGVIMALAMTGAMMLPCALPAWSRLLVHRDFRGGYGFLLGYGLLWACLAVAGAVVEAVLWPRHPSGASYAAVVLIAAVLQPLVPHLRGGDRAPFARAACAGIAHGRATLAVDAVPMSAVALSGAMDPAVMLAATAVMLALRLLCAELTENPREGRASGDRRCPPSGPGHQPNG